MDEPSSKFIKKHKKAFIKIIASLVILLFTTLISIFLANMQYETIAGLVLNIGAMIFTWALVIYFLQTMWVGDMSIVPHTVMAIVLATLSLPTAYYILSYGRFLSGFETFKIGTADGWLGYIGNIISGLITIVLLHPFLTRERLDRNNSNVDEVIVVRRSLTSRPSYNTTKRPKPNRSKKATTLIKTNDARRNGLSNLSTRKRGRRVI